jgi:hypothetical protein
MDVSMDEWKSPRAAEQPVTLVQRIRHRLVMYLLARFLRMAGWSAVVGLPGMILGPRRVAAIARRYPIAVGSLCIGGLIGLTLWNESPQSRPTELEIESIDPFDDPTVLLAQSPVIAPADDHSPNAAGEAKGTENDIVVIGDGPTTETSKDRQPVVWLTGHIEEVPSGKSESPVRNAVRFLPNRQ